MCEWALQRQCDEIRGSDGAGLVARVLIYEWGNANADWDFESVAVCLSEHAYCK